MEDIGDVCRLCSSSSLVLHDIFGPNPDEELHARMGPFLFKPLQVRYNDGLPQRVCEACCGQVLLLHQFCSEAQGVQTRLRALINPDPAPVPSCDQATQTEHAPADLPRRRRSHVPKADNSTQTDPDAFGRMALPLGPPCWLLDSIKRENAATPDTNDDDTVPETNHETAFVDVQRTRTLKRKSKCKTTKTPTQRMRRGKTEVKREPLQLIQPDPNHPPLSDGESDGFVELENYVQVQIAVSDSDEPLIDLKNSKNGAKKRTSKRKPASSTKKKAKTKKRKTKEDTAEKQKRDMKTDSDSDGLEDLEEYSKRQCKAPKSSVETEDPYARWCCVCSQTMPSLPACLQHYEAHLLEGPGPLPALPLPAADGRCPRCGKAAPAAEWPAHWARHQQRPHCCHLCRLSFASFDKFIAHGVKYHAQEMTAQDFKNDVKYMCDLCPTKFNTMKSLTRHRDAHASALPPRPRCARCAFSARSAGCLVQHARRKHAPRRHLCARCGKTFVSADKLKHHLVLHSGEKPYKCQYCARGFAAAGTRRDHERTHTGEKPHVCPQCARGFAQRSALVAHVRALHARARPHACALCGKAFAAKSVLNAHLKKPCVREDKPSALRSVSSPCPVVPKSEEYSWS